MLLAALRAVLYASRNLKPVPCTPRNPGDHFEYPSHAGVCFGTPQWPWSLDVPSYETGAWMDPPDAPGVGVTPPEMWSLWRR